jgi:Peptidase family S49
MSLCFWGRRRCGQCAHEAAPHTSLQLTHQNVQAQEIRRHVAFFRASGKPTVAYMKRGGEKEYYLATCCEEVYVPPTAQLALRGLSVSGAFLRGVLEKAGVEPQARAASACAWLRALLHSACNKHVPT